MKNALIVFTLTSMFNVLFAQQSSTELTIRNLEQQECKAALEKDTITLRRLWANEFTVNSPANRVVTGGKNTLDRPVINQADNMSFTRVIEHVMLKGDYAIVMGHEVVVPKGTSAVAPIPVKRRYTNVWMMEEGQWKLFARHANIICN
jgi:ketosteroid isomerase-like protein